MAHRPSHSHHCHPERSEGSFATLRMTGCGFEAPRSPAGVAPPRYFPASLAVTFSNLYISLFKNVTFSNHASERPVALDQDALHHPLLAHRIVDIDPMHGGAVVPDHGVTHRPFVGVMELGLAAVRGQLVEQRVALGARHADDAVEAVEVEIERLAAVVRMRAHQRMLD